MGILMGYNDQRRILRRLAKGLPITLRRYPGGFKGPYDPWTHHLQHARSARGSLLIRSELTPAIRYATARFLFRP